MRYEFVRTREFTTQYQDNNPGKSHMLWLDILNEAVNAAVQRGARVASVGYDPMGEPMSILFELSDDAPRAI